MLMMKYLTDALGCIVMISKQKGSDINANVEDGYTKEYVDENDVNIEATKICPPLIVNIVISCK